AEGPLRDATRDDDVPAGVALRPRQRRPALRRPLAGAAGGARMDDDRTSEPFFPSPRGVEAGGIDVQQFRIGGNPRLHEEAAPSPDLVLLPPPVRRPGRLRDGRVRETDEALRFLLEEPAMTLRPSAVEVHRHLG